MILLSGLLDVVFRALVFIGLALSVGGIIFNYVILKPVEPRNPVSLSAIQRNTLLIVIGAFVIALSQIGAILTDLSSLADQTGSWPVSEFLSTSFAHAGILHTAFALCLGIAAIVLLKRPRSQVWWGLTVSFGALVIIGGAWLTHGASRLHNAGALMSVTVIHQLAAVAWIGGVMHLSAQWQLLRRQQKEDIVWPRMLKHFSPMAVIAVAVLVGSGIYLSWNYIGSMVGLVGTAYGIMLLTKIILMGGGLLLGGINALTIRNWALCGDCGQVLRRVPVFAQAEAGIGATILMAAAALTGQPPSVDVVNQQATPAEVLHVFMPKKPQLTPAPYAKMLAHATSSLDIYSQPTYLEKIQSDFNHNISGIFVILLGIGALLHHTTKMKWTRHWPLLFIPFAGFLLTFAEPTGWPLGHEGFFNTLIAPETLTHRLATVLVLFFGFFQWRLVATDFGRTNWRYALPVIYVLGGAMLLTHTHSIYADKRTYLIEASHNAIGILAIYMGAAGWVEQRLDGRERQISSSIWPICLILVGFVLLFYREL